jgi:hypothetical protein
MIFKRVLVGCNTCLDALARFLADLDVLPQTGLDGDVPPVEFGEGTGDGNPIGGMREGREGDFAGHFSGVEELVVGNFVDGGTVVGVGTEEGGY